MGEAGNGTLETKLIVKVQGHNRPSYGLQMAKINTIGHCPTPRDFKRSHNSLLAVIGTVKATDYSYKAANRSRLVITG